MVDFHTHVLPGVDDGSKSVAESIGMLRSLKQQGVRMAAATPHFYPTEDTPEGFLLRRGIAAKMLEASLPDGLPQVVLGAEVYYFTGISRSEQIEGLRLSGTDLLLLEMPFSAWTAGMLREVAELNSRQNIQVVLAHVERYMRWQGEKVWKSLREKGVLMQCNPSFFLDWKTKRKARKMLYEGQIHFIGSDCHNMTVRPPKIGQAMEAVGREGQKILQENASRYAPALRGK